MHLHRVTLMDWSCSVGAGCREKIGSGSAWYSPAPAYVTTGCMVLPRPSFCHFGPLLPALVCSEGALDRCQITVDGSTNSPRALPGVSPASSGQLPDGITRLYFSLGSPSTCYTYSSVVGDFINMTNPTHWSEWQGRAKCFNVLCCSDLGQHSIRRLRHHAHPGGKRDAADFAASLPHHVCVCPAPQPLTLQMPREVLPQAMPM